MCRNDIVVCYPTARVKLLVTSSRIALILFWVPGSSSLPVYPGSHLKCLTSLVPCPPALPWNISTAFFLLPDVPPFVEMEFSKTQLQMYRLPASQWLVRKLLPCQACVPLDWSCLKIKLKKKFSQAVVAHTFKPSIWEAKAERSL